MFFIRKKIKLDLYKIRIKIKSFKIKRIMIFLTQYLYNNYYSCSYFLYILIQYSSYLIISFFSCFLIIMEFFFFILSFFRYYKLHAFAIVFYINICRCSFAQENCPNFFEVILQYLQIIIFLQNINQNINCISNIKI